MAIRDTRSPSWGSPTLTLSHPRRAGTSHLFIRQLPLCMVGKSALCRHWFLPDELKAKLYCSVLNAFSRLLWLTIREGCSGTFALWTLLLINMPGTGIGSSPGSRAKFRRTRSLLICQPSELSWSHRSMSWVWLRPSRRTTSRMQNMDPNRESKLVIQLNILLRKTEGLSHTSCGIFRTQPSTVGNTTQLEQSKSGPMPFRVTSALVIQPVKTTLLLRMPSPGTIGIQGIWRTNWSRRPTTSVEDLGLKQPKISGDLDQASNLRVLVRRTREEAIKTRGFTPKRRQIMTMPTPRMSATKRQLWPAKTRAPKLLTKSTLALQRTWDSPMTMKRLSKAKATDQITEVVTLHCTKTHVSMVGWCLSWKMLLSGSVRRATRWTCLTTESALNAMMNPSSDPTKQIKAEIWSERPWKVHLMKDQTAKHRWIRNRQNLWKTLIFHLIKILQTRPAAQTIQRILNFLEEVSLHCSKEMIRMLKRSSKIKTKKRRNNHLLKRFNNAFYHSEPRTIPTSVKLSNWPSKPPVQNLSISSFHFRRSLVKFLRIKILQSFTLRS